MKTLRELRDEVIRLNPNDTEYIKENFNTYLTKSLPPLPGFFEGSNLEFPLGSEYDKAYRTINQSTYRFHHLDRETLLYVNQENHFKYHGYYEK